MSVLWNGAFDLAEDSSVLLAPSGTPWTLQLIPLTGATVTVEITATPADALGDGGADADWDQLGSPLIAATMISSEIPVSAIRVSVSGGDARGALHS